MKDNTISYIELKTNDLEKTKEFYSKSFGWTFTDYGPTYKSFKDSGLSGGFELTQSEVTNGALIVLYHQNLESIMQTVVEHGGKISKDIFPFPGGRRFHFVDTSGNELAVWSDK